MAKHAKRVVQANGVDHIVTVIQGAVEDVILPEEDWENIGGSGVGLTREEGDVDEDMIDDGKGGKKKNQRVVDIILSEWMGYFLLRGTSVLDLSMIDVSFLLYDMPLFSHTNFYTRINHLKNITNCFKNQCLIL